MSTALSLYVDAGYASPWAMSVHVGLQEKGLAFDTVTVDLDAGGQREPGFASRSLTRRVPTLQHGDFTLTESSAITEYLDEVFDGPRLYPAASRERAIARQVQAWLRSDLRELRSERSTEVIFRGVKEGSLSEAARASADKLFDVAARLLGHGREHLFADWCIADVDLAMALQRLVAHGDAVPPRLADYARAQWARPSVRRWVGMKRPA